MAMLRVRGGVEICVLDPGDRQGFPVLPTLMQKKICLSYKGGRPANHINFQDCHFEYVHGTGAVLSEE